MSGRVERRALAGIALVTVLVIAACGGGTDGTAPTSPGTPTGTVPTTPVPATTSVPPVHVVLFTHIEDNTPSGLLSAATTRAQYVNLRARLLEMAVLARRFDARWTLQPDWKFLLAALEYEDAGLRASTGNLNVLRFLRDSLATAIDAHSHEGSGYNYTDVAHLLDSLGVGGTTVIGGHIWDPALPQFSQWDRFRVPVRGQQFPATLWRGDILMGSGTPNHVNDPIVSGVWRPKDRNSYFEDDPAGNIAAIGAWRSDVPGIVELAARYRSGQTATTCMLTGSMPISPSTLTAAGGLTEIENTLVKPLAILRDSAQVKFTNFTALAATWKAEFGARACIYRVSPAAR
jgi:hypothetical protein